MEELMVRVGLDLHHLVKIVLVLELESLSSQVDAVVL